jgi:SAM-dependent methyltransferase
MAWIGQFRSQDDAAILDIGGRDLNGSPRQFFPNANPYHVVDLRPGPNVDIVADAGGDDIWNFCTPGTYDMVICTEVFEHAQNWRNILLTAWEVLRPGGRIVFTCAGPGRPEHSGIEPVWGLIDGEFYANVSPEEIGEELHIQGWTETLTRLYGTDTQGHAVKPFRKFKVHDLGATLSRTADRAANLDR